MLFPDLPAKWKRLIPALLTGVAIIVFALLDFFGASTGSAVTVMLLISSAVGLLLGINWTPPDPPAPPTP
jgi:hypothetical protein